MLDVEFSEDTSIYKDNGRRVLRDEYEPDELVGREDIKQQYARALSPVYNGDDPDTILIYGKTGVGKTFLTNAMLKTLKKKASEETEVDVNITKQNCEGLRKEYNVYTKLVNKLRSPDNQIASSGYHRSEVRQFLFEELEEQGGVTLIVLDEMDSINDDELSRVLYHFLRARSEGPLKDAKVGIIGITSDLRLKEKLRDDVKSSLDGTSIQFTPYDSQELSSVLEQRAHKAFCDGAVPEGAVSKCASYGASDGGDARRAIKILRKAGDLARNEQTNKISINHVDRAYDKLIEDKVIEEIRAKSPKEKISLYSLITLERSGADAPRTKRIHKRFRKFAMRAAYKPVKPRQIQRFMSAFDDANITDAINVSGGRDGHYQTHTLRDECSIPQVLSALEDVIEECGVHDSVSGVETIQHLKK